MAEADFLIATYFDSVLRGDAFVVLIVLVGILKKIGLKSLLMP
jgi:hypothetical protein